MKKRWEEDGWGWPHQKDKDEFPNNIKVFLMKFINLWPISDYWAIVIIPLDPECNFIM